MAVLVDPPAWAAHGRRWSHLTSDASLAELHAFARRLGIPDRGFEGDHYDIPEERYAAAVAAGAIPVSSRELLRRLQVSGLRRPKRRGEKVLASRPGAAPGERIDTLLSRMPPLGSTRAVLVLATSGQEILVLPDDEGLLLPRAEVGAGAVAGEAASAILTEFLETTTAGTGFEQLGYLRVVTGVWRTGVVEIVMRWRGLDGAERHEPARRAAWVPATHAARLVPGELAPLIMFHARTVR